MTLLRSVKGKKFEILTRAFLVPDLAHLTSLKRWCYKLTFSISWHFILLGHKLYVLKRPFPLNIIGNWFMAKTEYENVNRAIFAILLWQHCKNSKHFKRLRLELRQYKDDFIQSKIIPISKLPLFFTAFTARGKGGNFKIGIIFNWIESFLYCL